MHSSTSSSEEFNAEHQSKTIDVHDEVYAELANLPYRIIPDKQWTSIIVIAFIISLFALVGWEYLARAMHHTTGKYQSTNTRMWAEERGKLDTKNDIKIVLTGSSRTLWGFDMNVVNNEIGTKPLQLALPGTGPALFAKDVVENTDFSGLLIVGVAPFLFNRMDEGFFGQGALDAYHNQTPSKYTGSILYDFLSYNLAFIDESFELPALMERYIDLPVRKNATDLMGRQWKLGDSYEERLTKMWPPVEEVGSFDNTQLMNFWMGGLKRKPPPAEKIQEMAQTSIDFYAPLIKELRSRGGDMVFVRLPSSGEYLKFDLKTDYYNNMWKPMIEGLEVVGLNAMDYPELSDELETPEWSHLSRASQDKFSHIVFGYIDKEYQKKFGHSVYKIIGVKTE